jgi:hypothetical protein
LINSLLPKASLLAEVFKELMAWTAAMRPTPVMIPVNMPLFSH